MHLSSIVGGMRKAAIPAAAAMVCALLGACGGSNSPGSGATQGVQNAPGGSGLQSTNWSGYALTGSALGFHQVSASWTVPVPDCGSSATASATWAGIGGLLSSDPTLIQAGTEQDCNGGSASYYAWWEGYPAPSEDIRSSGNYPVHGGDQVNVAIDSTALVVWNISIHDLTAGWTYTNTTPFVAVGESAEWIEEAPLEVGSGAAAQASLSDFGIVSFSALEANGANPDLSAADGIQMINASNAVIANPSAPGSGGDSFDVCYGAGSCN